MTCHRQQEWQKIYMLRQQRYCFVIQMIEGLSSPLGDLGIGMALSYPLLYNIWVRVLKSCSNRTKLSMMGSQLFSGWCQMFLDVFRCSQDALNWLQIFWWHSQMCSRVLENDPVGSKILKRNVCVSDSEIKIKKELPDHEVFKMCSNVQMKLRIECFKCSIRPHWQKMAKINAGNL